MPTRFDTGQPELPISYGPADLKADLSAKEKNVEITTASDDETVKMNRKSNSSTQKLHVELFVAVRAASSLPTQTTDPIQVSDKMKKL